MKTIYGILVGTDWHFFIEYKRIFCGLSFGGTHFYFWNWRIGDYFSDLPEIMK